MDLESSPPPTPCSPAAAAPLRTTGWVDDSACLAVCLLILDDRRGGGAVCAQAAAATGDAERRQRRALPPTLYANHVAPFLRFDAPLPNMLYAIGGRSHRQGALSEVEMLDTWHGRWVPRPPMPTRRAGGSAACLPCGRILVVGGYDERGIVDGLLASCDIYDPYKNCWQEDGAAPLARSRWGHGCAALGGLVYAVGGCSLQRGATQEPREAFMETLRACEVYNPATNRWSPAPALQVARSGVRVVTMESGYLAAVGGCDDVFGRAETQPTVELFDPAAGCWTLLTTRLQRPRTTAAVVPLGSSRLAVIGGAPSLACAEVYEASPPGAAGKCIQDSQDCQENGDEAATAQAGGASAEQPRESERRFLADLSEGRMGCQAASLWLPAEGRGYPAGATTGRLCGVVVGGERCSDGAAGEWPRVRQFAAVPVFDVLSESWRPADDPAVPALPFPRTAVALCVGLGRVQTALAASEKDGLSDAAALGTTIAGRQPGESLREELMRRQVGESLQGP